MFNWLKKTYFSVEEKHRITRAIRIAESKTSGEIRLFIEGKCKSSDPLSRAHELFGVLEIEKTTHRNGILLYVAMHDQKFAIYADQGIHGKVGEGYWRQQLSKLKTDFGAKNFTTGIIHCIFEIGTTLNEFFPDYSEDENELPDDIVFGKM